MLPRRVPARPVGDAIRKFSDAFLRDLAEHEEKRRENADPTAAPSPTFGLIGVLKAYYREPAKAKTAVQQFCELIGQDFRGQWWEVRELWKKRDIIDDGNDGWDWATARVDDEPLDVSSFSVELSQMDRDDLRDINRAASLCWLLHVYNAQGAGLDPIQDAETVLAIALSGQKLAAWMGFGHHDGGYALRNALVRAGVIRCTNADYKFNGKNKKAQKFKLTGTFTRFLSHLTYTSTNEENEEHEAN